MSWHKNFAECATALPSRRAVIAALTTAAVLPAASPSFAAPAVQSSAEDERFMRMALAEARRGDFPFGAVIVRGSRVLMRGRNLGRTNDDPTAHGEITAIRRCLTAHGSEALMGSTLYTSGEPCGCAWAQFSGAASADSSTPRRCSNSPAKSIRS